MFERDHYGLNPELQRPQARGGLTASRHALTQQRYIEEKHIRLEKEATERRHQASVEQDRAAARAFDKAIKILRAVLDLFSTQPRRQVK